jgi:hypothetical protein
MWACLNSYNNPAGFPAALAALLAASSAETRRARSNGGFSALDVLLDGRQPPFQPWEQQAVVNLLAAGVPVARHNAPLVLPIAARLGERRAAQLAAVERSAGTTWREHERMVHLAFDVRDLREAEEAVRVRERRVQELEGELRALGVGSEDTEDDDESGEGEDEGGGAVAG